MDCVLCLGVVGVIVKPSGETNDDDDGKVESIHTLYTKYICVIYIVQLQLNMCCLYYQDSEYLVSSSVSFSRFHLFFFSFFYFCACWGYFFYPSSFFVSFFRCCWCRFFFCLIQQRHHPAITHEMLRDCETRSFRSRLFYVVQRRIVSRIDESHRTRADVYKRVGKGRKEERKKKSSSKKEIQSQYVYKKRRDAVVSTRRRRRRKKTRSFLPFSFLFFCLFEFRLLRPNNRRPIIKEKKKKKNTAVLSPAQLLV